MKKGLLAGVVGISLFVGWPLMAAEEHSKMTSEFCAKHCNAVQLRADVNALEKAITADKAALQAGKSDEKITALIVRKDALKKKIDEAMKVLESLKAETDQAEADLSQLTK